MFAARTAVAHSCSDGGSPPPAVSVRCRAISVFSPWWEGQCNASQRPTTDSGTAVKGSQMTVGQQSKVVKG